MNIREDEKPRIWFHESIHKHTVSETSTLHHYNHHRSSSSPSSSLQPSIYCPMTSTHNPQIVLSIDHLTSQKLGYCDTFHVEKFLEQHGSAGQGGNFRALVAQLLQVENLPESDEGDEESCLEIITSLSWEAATLLKLDTSQGGGMDPGGYVKVKCIACGRRSERYHFREKFAGSQADRVSYIIGVMI